MRANPANRPVRVVVVIYDGLALMEFGVACDVFGIDRSEVFGRPWYRFAIAAPAVGPVLTDAGISVLATSGPRALASADLVIVPPTERLGDVPSVVLDALRRAHRRGARIASLCTGAFVLGAAGLLSGRRATTHWEDAAALAAMYPDAEIDPAVLYIEHGNILSSAGSAASIDLALHIVAQDHGAEIAAEVARDLVVPRHRDGGQAQYLRRPIHDTSDAAGFEDTLAWVGEHLGEPITVDALARRSAMSPRTFARRFSETMGCSPYRWLVRERVEEAKRLLETTDMPVEWIATETGFSSAANLRKHFAADVEVSPQAYRRAFRG